MLRYVRGCWSSCSASWCVTALFPESVQRFTLSDLFGKEAFDVALKPKRSATQLDGLGKLAGSDQLIKCCPADAKRGGNFLCGPECGKRLGVHARYLVMVMSHDSQRAEDSRLTLNFPSSFSRGLPSACRQAHPPTAAT